MNTFRFFLPLILTISKLFLLPANSNGHVFESRLRMPTDRPESECSAGNQGTRWAVLVAGSNGFGNYRHQADVCHAYQLLKNDGLKDENIVVFMFDDIANHSLNPNPGIVINHPKGENVYTGVPKDYTGDQVTAENLYAVLLGDRTAVNGGSGKVVDSKSNDRIFLYYSDHGGPGVLGMPNLPYVYAKDFIDVLKKKHEAGAYKEMLVYIEACESGSMFEGIMPNDMNIYVTTASNAQESSFGTYCPGMNPAPPPEYVTCLGDLYSVAWMEDSEGHNLREETIDEQYNAVRVRVSNNNTYATGSHVMEYGSEDMKAESLCLYQGFSNGSLKEKGFHDNKVANEGVDQRDADLVFLFEMYKKPGVNKTQVGETMRETVGHRTHMDASVKMIGALLMGVSNGIGGVRERGLPLVDDWECLKSTVRVFERGCGTLRQYGMKHMRAFANICNAGIPRALVEEAVAIACGGYNDAKLHPFFIGYSA